jgi:coenzyme F420-reducing hydrogenase beta subunit
MKKPKAFAVINRDERVRMDSSSGGVFTLLAESVIDRNGAVFGARFNERWDVEHEYTESKEGLAPFRGSKYAQSRLGGAYKDVKRFLEEGKWVLFSGTPCQVGGLKEFLGGEYENLICVDIICHGAPAPEVWRKYVSFRESSAGSGVEKIQLRRKCGGWTRYSVSFTFEGGGEYREFFDRDPFMLAFLADLCLLPSCYRCGFKGVNRVSDITIADFWGVQNVAPKMFDDRGTSLVLIHSSKGQAAFDRIKVGADTAEVDCEEALRYNPSAVRSCAEHRNRGGFMGDIDKLPFDRLVKKYARPPFAKRIFTFVRGTLVRIIKLAIKCCACVV